MQDFGVLGFLPLDNGDEAYVCGVDDQTEQSRWLASSDGVITDADGLWSMTRDGANFELTGPDGIRTGELTAFESGGLFAAEPEPCRSGAILHAGTVTGTWCDGLGTFMQVEPVDTLLDFPETIEVQLRDLDTYVFILQRLP